MRVGSVLARLLALALVALPACEPVPEHSLAELPSAEPLSNPAGSWLALGSRLLAAGQPVEAEKAFIRSLRVEGATAEALIGAGVAVQSQGLLTKARRYFERATELDPGSVAAHNNLGAALYGLGEIHAARHAFRTAFALSSGTSDQAAQNLAMAESAIARAEAEENLPAGDAEKLQRTGSSEYKLILAPGTAAEG